MEKEKNTMTYEQREKIGNRASIFGICVNFLLAFSKILLGVLTGLVSVVADGINNLTDCGSGVVSLISFRIAAKPADKEHPYGHRRAEYIATMIIAFLVLFLSVELFRESIAQVMRGTLSMGGLPIYILLGVSFAVKGGMFLFYRTVAKKISSDALKAASVDSACDCISTFAVFVGVLVSQFAGFPADGWAGIVVALFIAWQGINLLRETASKLLGQAVDSELIEEIRTRILQSEGVLGIHDLKVYNYGPGKFFASVHIEVDARVPVLEAHERIDEIERDFIENTGIMLTGHLDPIVTDDEPTNVLRAQVVEKIAAITDGWSIHDFRVVWGERLTKVIFDTVVPFAEKRTDGEIAQMIMREVESLGAYEAVVTVERE